MNNSQEKLTKMVSVRFSESQYKEIQEMAQQKQRRESDLIRILTMTAIEQMKKV